MAGECADPVRIDAAQVQACAVLSNGRAICWGDNEFGPYQSPMEDGMQHFHEWYRREMGASKTTQMI